MNRYEETIAALHEEADRLEREMRGAGIYRGIVQLLRDNKVIASQPIEYHGWVIDGAIELDKIAKSVTFTIDEKSKDFTHWRIVMHGLIIQNEEMSESLYWCNTFIIE